MSDITEVQVWDAPVRLFHWGVVAGFATAYVSGDALLGVHTGAGYGVLGLLAFRLVWGFVGTPHARFGDFVASPRAGWPICATSCAGAQRATSVTTPPAA